MNPALTVDLPGGAWWSHVLGSHRAAIRGAARRTPFLSPGAVCSGRCSPRSAFRI